MRAGIQYRRWLFYLALALPSILLPQESFWSLHGGMHFSLGWPLSDFDLQIGHDGDGKAALLFQPSPVFLPLAVLSTYIASLAWRVRMWTKARPDWLGAFVQAALTSLYGALVFCFFDGLIGTIWEWWMTPAQWPAVERAGILASYWLPYLYILGTVAIITVLFLDARLRVWPHRLIHAGFALCFLFAAYRLAPYLIWQIDQSEWLVRYAREQQLEPDSERPKKDTRRLDQLQQVFASTPRLIFGDTFWQASRRVAHERGPRILIAVMERSRQWTGEEGLIFVPLVALLPRKSVLNTLKHYEHSENESERVNAREFLVELDAEDTKEAVEHYSKNLAAVIKQ